MDIRDELRATINALRAEANRLEALISAPEIANVDPGTEWPVFDPDIDTPPFELRLGDGREINDWVCIMLWSQLLAHNVRRGETADRAVTVRMSKASGYRDGRGYNGWRLGRTRHEDGTYSINADGIQHLNHYLRERQVRLPEDLAVKAREMLDERGYAELAGSGYQFTRGGPGHA